MFDLPSKTAEEKRSAAKFRKFLRNDGFHMLQYSIYVRICNGLEAVKKHEHRLQANLPRYGSIRVLKITEYQYESMMVYGNKSHSMVDKKFEDIQISLF